MGLAKDIAAGFLSGIRSNSFREHMEAYNARFAERNAPSVSEPWGPLLGEIEENSSLPLGTARWMLPQAAAEKFQYSRASLYSDRFWIGEGLDQNATSLGYRDDRHVCLVSGSRGGKGVGAIIPNLCFWAGSCIVVDPKGENATVTARRRGSGSEYTHGLGQKVCILDPFGEVPLPNSLKAHYNPLDAIDPNSDLAVDDAGRVAAALVVVQSQRDPYWEEAAQSLIKGLILHVISAPYLAHCRNLVTVRRLLSQGDWLSVEELRQAGDKDIPSAFVMLWEQMKLNPAFNGTVAGVGEQMASMPEKTLSGVLESARTNTVFLDSTPMQRILERSDFSLGELKTLGSGLTIYLTLPQRYMETHYRWLRLMIALAVGEMERIKERPATGHPTLFVLDEFAGLKRMEVIENAAAQAAGFGVKFLFVVQNLPQLEELYQKSWETFFGNSGLKLFFQIDDDFTRNYLSRQLGELETVRQTRSGSQSSSTSTSKTSGDGFSARIGLFSAMFGLKPKQPDWGDTASGSSSKSTGRSNSTSDGWGESVQKRHLLNPDEIGRFLARIDDTNRPGYPGLVLALVPGEQPLLARRVNYFRSPRFIGYFDPHPLHPPPPTLAQLRQRSAEPEERPTAQVFHVPRPPSKKYWNFIGAGSFGALLFFMFVAPHINLRTTVPLRYATVSGVLNLNLRQGPGPNYDPVATMPQGVRVKIIRDAENGWEELEVPGNGGQVFRGFANGKYLAPSQ